MDVMERGATSPKKVNKHGNKLFTSLSNHLNGKTRNQKSDSTCVLIIE
jgi:hypothetical protein